MPTGEPALRSIATYLERARPALSGADPEPALFLSKSGRRLSTSRRPAPSARVGAARRHADRRAPARPASFLRHPSARGRRGPESDPGDAGSRQHLDDPGLHSGRVRPASGGIRKEPPAGVKEAALETNVKAIELKDLWRRYKTDGSDKAREQLVVAYSPLVKYVAGRMSSGLPAHVEEADLISYGLLGLINAIERFDLTREIKFETYAITRIKGAIIDELRALDWVPRSVRARAREIEKVHAKLEHQLHRTPTDEEMARELKITVEEFQEALVKISTSTVVALDELWAVSDSSGDAVSLLDTLQDPDAPDPEALLAQSEVKDRLADAIAALPGAREARDRPLLLREPDAARDRRGPRRDRVAHLPAAHEGRAAPEVPPSGRQPARLAQPAGGSVHPSDISPRERGGTRHAARRRQDPQRGPSGPPREREDVVARGLDVRGRRDDEARLGG